MKNLNKKRVHQKKDFFSSIFLSIFLLTGLIHSLWSHGTVTNPPSRVWVCYSEIIAADATNPIPESPACLSSFYAYGAQAFYDWNEVARMDANGMHEAVVPDGNLASAGRPDKYGGLDQVRDDWLTTSVTPGPFTVTWTNTAPHETLYYRVYITKEDWTPDQPLTWDSLELLVETDPRPAASTDVVDLVLPQRAGKHVLFSVWQRSLSEEAFYATSDVDFGSGVIESVAPVADFTTDSGICGGSEVLFDASNSYDVNGDELTYVWDFGDGTTAEGIETTHTYTGLNTATVMLTVSDGEFSSGTSEIINLIKEENCTGLVCAFDAPREDALPPVEATYYYSFVIGDNGPNMDNVTAFVINWDGSNNLYQFDFNLAVAPHYVSFSEAEHTFNQASPQIIIEGTNIEGLDGDYYVTVDGDNFLLVSKEGGYTIYFSLTDMAPECEDADVDTIETLTGGTLTSNVLKYEFTVGDEDEDYVVGIALADNVGESFQWVVANQAGNIVSLPNNIEDFNFDGVDLEEGEEERLFIYNLSYNGAITGLTIGGSTISLSGDYELSNAIEVYVTTEETNTTTGSCTFDTPRSAPIPVMNYRSYNTDDSQGSGSITVIGENGPDLSPYRKLDFAYTDGEISTFFFQTWGTFQQVNLIANAEEAFDQVSPELTLSNTGIPNFNGSYYVNVIENDDFGADFADFVMVSKSGDFSIYFTYSNEAPECDATLSVTTNEIQNNISVKQNYPNPFSESTTIEYALSKKSNVSLRIYNLKGQLITTLVNSEQEKGNHEFTFDLPNASSGIYLYVIETEDRLETKRMILQK